MPRQEELLIELDGAPVRATLSLPEAAASGAQVGVVLLCTGLPGCGPRTRELHDAITDAFVEAKVAVAVVARGAAAAPGGRLAVEAVDDAAAVVHGLALREDLDLDRLGLLGHAAGAIVAACLARRSDRIDRLCLLGPITTDELAGRLAADPPQDVAARLGGAADLPSGYFEGLDALSPIEDLAACDRATLILHGASDRVVDPGIALAYRDRLLAAGRRVDHVLVALGDHLLTNETARSAALGHLTRFFTAAAQTPAPAPRT